MTEVALLSLGTTAGLRHADDALAELIEEAGAGCRLIRVRIGATRRLRRHITVTDLVEGLAARRAARAIGGARALIVSGATTALLLPRPNVRWALRFDSPAALNRTGVSGAWQRSRERQVLPRADLLLPWGEAAAQAAEHLMAKNQPMIPLPPPIDVAVKKGSDPFCSAVAYAGWMWKRGIDRLVVAWREAAPPGTRLLIGGAEKTAGEAWLHRQGIEPPPNVEWAGMLPREQWLEQVAGARIFINASRREDYGIAQLEALALGTPVVTIPSPGPYEALPIARRLAPQLVSEDLAQAIRAGLELDDSAYAERAKEALAPYRRDHLLTIVRDEALPALGL